MWFRPREGSLAICVVVWALVLISCGQQDSNEALPPPAKYQVRGLVRQVKSVSDGSTQLSIHHEAMPEFVGIKGEIEGMKSMTMPFSVAESVDLEGIAPGIKIAFQLTVDWSASEPALITRIEILPQETELELSG